MPNPRLVFVSVNPGSEVDLSGSVSIGRADDNQVRLSDETVSHYHAIIEERSGGFWLSDLGSTRGTTVNGEPIGSSHHLRDGDLISVGGVSLRYLENGSEASAFGSVSPGRQPTAHRPDAGRSGMPPARPARAAAKKRGFSTGQIVAASTAGLLFLVILSALIYKAFNGGPPTGDPTPTPTPTVGTDPEGQLKLQEIRGMVEKLAIRINQRGEVFDDDFLIQIRAATESYRTEMFTDAERLRSEIRRAASASGIPSQLMFVLAASRSGFKDDQTVAGCGADPSGVGVLKVPSQLMAQFGAGQATDQRTAAEVAAKHLEEMMGGQIDNFIYAVACFGQPRARIGEIEEQTDPQERRNFPALVKKGDITTEEAGKAVCFFAAGIVAENPNQFGVNARSFVELY